MCDGSRHDCRDHVERELWDQGGAVSALVNLGLTIRKANEHISSAVMGVAEQLDEERRGKLAASQRDDHAVVRRTVLDLLDEPSIRRWHDEFPDDRENLHQDILARLDATAPTNDHDDAKPAAPTLDEILDAARFSGPEHLERRVWTRRVAALSDLDPEQRLGDVLHRLDRLLRMQPASPLEAWLLRAAKIQDNHRAISKAFLAGQLTGDVLASMGAACLPTLREALESSRAQVTHEAAVALQSLLLDGATIPDDVLDLAQKVADNTTDEPTWNVLKVVLEKNGREARPFELVDREPDDDDDDDARELPRSARGLRPPLSATRQKVRNTEAKP